MHERVMSARKVLTTLINLYNENAASAAYWRACDHPAYESCALSAGAMLEAMKSLFKDGRDYVLHMVDEELLGVKFGWRKAEVTEGVR